MADFIGTVAVPEIVPSGSFPLATSYPHGLAIAPRVIVHPFISGSVKIEQRFLLGDGARRYRLTFAELYEDEMVSLADFFEDNQGALGAFTYAAPSDDGASTTDVIVRFEDQGITFERLVHLLSRSGVTLVEIPDPDNAPVYSVAETVDRFPGATLEAALTGQVQQLIPLIKIEVLQPDVNASTLYPDIFLSDRRCTVGGQLYQARLLSWTGIGQRLGAQSDSAGFNFGNADHVMRDVANSINLFRARIRFSLFHVGTGIKIDLWSGIILSYESQASGAEFSISAVDGLYDITLQYPPDRIGSACWKNFNDGLGCKFATLGALNPDYPDADGSKCDHGYATPNGCQAHSMKTAFGGVIINPESIRTKDNSQGFFGFGRPTVTATSSVSDTMQGQPLQEIYTDIPIRVKALLASGRDEGDFYAAIGIVGAGPLGAYGQGTFDNAGNERTHTLDGQFNHGHPDKRIGLREILGADPASTGDFLSIDASDNFAGGVAFAFIRRSDEKGIQPTSLDSHTMEVVVAQGLQGYSWTAPGARVTALMTNPIWIAVNAYLRGIGLRYADAATQELYFDVDAAILWAGVADLVVDKLIGDGTETQFKFNGVLRDVKALRDWIQEILNNALGTWVFANGKLKIGMREDAAASHSFSGGNMIFGSLQLRPIQAAFNRLTVTFANSDYEFVADTIPITDYDHVIYLGKTLDSGINLAGAAGKSMAGRIGGVRLKEELGGVGYVEQSKAKLATWKTTVLGLGVECGMGVSIDDDEMPDGTGLQRILSWTLNPDMSIDLEGRTITDSMYDQVFGPKAADVPANIVPSQFMPLPLRPVWHPNRESPDANDALYDVFDRTFQMRQTVELAPDGSRRMFIVARGDAPLTLPQDTKSPIIRTRSLGHAGSLKGGRKYYVAVCAKMGNKCSPLSNIVGFWATEGVDDYSLFIGNIHWPDPPAESGSAWDGWILFACDRDNRKITAQDQGDSETALPSSFTIEGPLRESTFNPPSQIYRAVRIKVKLMSAPGPVAWFITDLPSGGTTIVAAGLGTSTLTNPIPGFDAAMLATDDWTGRVLTVLPKSSAAEDTGPYHNGVPIINLNITAYDPVAGAFTVDDDPAARGVKVGDVFVVRFKFTFSPDFKTMTDTRIVNGNFPFGLVFDQHTGDIARILAGPGRGQWRIVDGTNVNQFTLDRPWDSFDLPDENSIIAIEEHSWLYSADSTPILVDQLEQLIKLQVEVSNQPGKGALVMATLLDRQLKETPEELAHVREFYIFGDPGILGGQGGPGEAPFDIRRERYAYLTIIDNEITENLGIGALRAMNYFAPYIDDTDAHWWASAELSSSEFTAEVTLVVTFHNVSRHGIAFKVGDYVVWNDPLHYEINRIIAMDDLESIGIQSWTLSRRDPSLVGIEDADSAYFGSKQSAHIFNTQIFRLVPQLLSDPVKAGAFGSADATGVQDKHEFPVPIATIPAIVSQAIGDSQDGPLHVRSLLGRFDTGEPPSPGFRTLKGNGYKFGIGGALAIGSHADFRGARVVIPETIRCVYGYVSKAPVGAQMIAAVVWVSEDRSFYGLVEILKINADEFASYDVFGSKPDSRQMPYHDAWSPTIISPYDYPPTILPSVTNGFDANGDIKSDAGELTTDASTPCYMVEGGYLDVLILTPAGAEDLIVVVLT